MTIPIVSISYQSPTHRVQEAVFHSAVLVGMVIPVRVRLSFFVTLLSASVVVCEFSGFFASSL